MIGKESEFQVVGRFPNDHVGAGAPSFETLAPLNPQRLELQRPGPRPGALLGTEPSPLASVNYDAFENSVLQNLQRGHRGRFEQ